MQHSSLIRILSTLNIDEWKRFERFVRSPYFNTNKALTSLFLLLKKYHPLFDSPKLEKQSVFKKIFSTNDYKEKRMWQLMSDLKSLAEQFLVVEKVDKKSIPYQIQLRECFHERALYDWFEQNSTTIVSKLSSTDSYLPIHQFYLHQIHNDLYYDNRSVNYIPNHPSLIAANEHLQAYFYIQQLKYACEWASRKWRINEELPIFLKTIIYRNKYKNNMLYCLYYKLFQLFNSVDHTNQLAFESVYVLIKENIDQVPPKDQLAFLLYLINYGIKQIHIGKEIYQPIIFDLYKFGLEKQILLHKEKMTEEVYINIIGLACRAEDFDWLNQFISKYKDCVNTNDKSHLLNLTTALIQFAKGQFLESLNILDHYRANIEKKELSRRALQIKSCLCLFLDDSSYYSLLVNKTQNHEKYISRGTKTNNARKSRLLKFYRYVRSFAKHVYEIATPEEVRNLYKKISQEEKLPNKTWLLSLIKKYC